MGKTQSYSEGTGLRLERFFTGNSEGAPAMAFRIEIGNLGSVRVLYTAGFPHTRGQTPASYRDSSPGRARTEKAPENMPEKIPDTKMYVVVDLDARSHRMVDILEAPYYDMPQSLVAAVRAIAKGGNTVDIWTGLSELSMRAAVEAMLVVRSVPYHQLLMRPVGDHRPARDLKREWMDLRGVPDLVFDSRSDTDAWWESMGVACVLRVLL